MKRHLFSAVASAVLLAAFVPAQAADVTSTFDVAVALAAKCEATNDGLTTLDFGTYTAFQGANATGSVGLTFKCTRGLGAPTFSFDAGNGGANGVLAGLNYSLAAASAITTAGTDASAGVAGTHDVRTVTVTGTMPSGQAGDVDAALATSHTRTLTVTY